MTLRNILRDISNDYPEPHWDEIALQKIELTATFVIPCYNSEYSILKTLQSIENQIEIDFINEVILIDDCSTDNTGYLIEEFANNSELNIIFLKNLSREYAAYSRNRGIESATGDIVCFIDSDIIVPPNYLGNHLRLHQSYNKAISVSLRSFIENSMEQFYFPVKNFRKEFRVCKFIPPDWCDTPERNEYANKTIRLLDETDNFKKLGYGQRLYWSLPEVCLTCAISYRLEDLRIVEGAPVNFKGWGYNDTSMAAKVISLDRFCIPIINCSVYHLSHKKRSGLNANAEFLANRAKYEKLLSMPQKSTFRTYIAELAY